MALENSNVNVSKVAVEFQLARNATSIAEVE